MILACWPAQAWAPDEWYETPADLPASIQAVLPAKMTYVEGMRGGDTIYVLLDDGDGSRCVYIFCKDGEDYQLDCKSAPLSDLHGSKAGIGSSGSNELYLIYDDGNTYFTFKRMHNNTWTLRYAQSHEEFGVDVVGLHQLNTDRYICGTVINADLSTLDATRLPATFAEAFDSMIDTDGWSFVKSDKPTDRLHLRTAPSTDAASIGRYYSGTPVQVLEDQGEWAKVSVAGIQGYMMMKFLAFGQDMLNVERWFPSKYLTEKDAEQGVNVYANPDTNATVIGVLRGGDGLRQYILANVGDDWYHVLRDDGLSGYVEVSHFWDGNG